MSLIQTKVRVFAFDRATAAPVLGDAANITAKWSKDYGTPTALTDTNPAEAEDGFYYFDLSEGERDVSIIGEIFPESATSGVQVIGVPAWFGAGDGGSGGGVIGPGGVAKEITVQSGGQPIDGAAVWITTDQQGTNIVAGVLYSNSLGKVSFMLEEDITYYIWVQKARVNFTNPTSFVIPS